MSFTVGDLAARVSGVVVGDPDMVIGGISAADTARAGDLTFAESDTYFAAAERCAASAILVSGVTASSTKVLIRVKSARVAVARLLPLFFAEERPVAGIHGSATISATAKIDPSAHVGSHCVIGDRVEIGANAVLHGGNHIGNDSRIGNDTELFSNVVLYPRTVIGSRGRIHAGTVIGSDGYGYVFDEGRHRKVLQVGNVVIGDDVEIGANCTVDRAALGSTRIGNGTKIDNLVQVAHNVELGQNCLVMGQSGLAGSARVGDYSVIASQSGIGGHLKLGRQSTVGAKSAVIRDVPDGGTVLGVPAAPDKQTKRQWIALQQLPELLRQVRELRKNSEEPGSGIDAD